MEKTRKSIELKEVLANYPKYADKFCYIEVDKRTKEEVQTCTYYILHVTDGQPYLANEYGEELAPFNPTDRDQLCAAFSMLLVGSPSVERILDSIRCYIEV